MNQKIIFFGTSEFAVRILEKLVETNFKPSLIITTPDQPAGRGKKIIPNPVKKFFTETINPSGTGMALLQPEKLDADFIAQIANFNFDMAVMASYGKILSKTLIDLFPNGVLNIHPSLLPKHRGSSPIQTTILNGDKETGITIILADEKMDHGPIFGQRVFDLTSSGGEVKWTYQSLHDALANLGAELLIEILPKWIAGEIEPKEQDHSQVTLTKLLKKSDGKIDWSNDADYVEHMVRAYNPWPGVFTHLDVRRLSGGSMSLKIVKAEVIENNKNFEAGRYFEADSYLAVACGKDALKLLVVQPEGKKEMSGRDFLHGHKDLLDQ